MPRVPAHGICKGCYSAHITELSYVLYGNNISTILFLLIVVMLEFIAICCNDSRIKKCTGFGTVF
jgi:hypothetical protein